MSNTEVDNEALAEEVIEQLDPGTAIGDKIILTRRQVAAIAGTGLGVSALTALGVGEAEAQAAGQVGTSTDPVDVFAESINDGGPVVDGDDTERTIWIIANGASDPADATAEDLIFEEEA